MKVAIVCCSRNEDLYIEEWVDWHLSIGVDHIFIADNDDLGSPLSLQAILKRHIENGQVSVLDYRKVVPVQMACYREIYSKFKDEYDWFGFIDVDEFLHIYKHRDIKDLLSDKVYQNYSGVFFFWRMFDDNGLIKYSSSPVQSRFTHYATYSEQFPNRGQYNLLKNGESSKAKSFIRGKIDFEIDLSSSPHYIFSRQQKTSFRNTCVDRNFSKEHNDDSFYKRVLESYSVAELRHFKYKTIEEFLNRRVLRRRSAYRGQNNDVWINQFWIINKQTQEKIDFTINWLDQNTTIKDKRFLSTLNKLVRQKETLISSLVTY